MSIKPPQSFDWTTGNLHKAFNKWLEEMNLFFELQKFKGEDKDYVAKTANVVKKKKSLFVHLLGRKGPQIYWSLTVKNAKGETVENDDERRFEMVIEAFKDYCKLIKTLTVDRVEFLRKNKVKMRALRTIC